MYYYRQVFIIMFFLYISISVIIEFICRHDSGVCLLTQSLNITNFGTPEK